MLTLTRRLSIVVPCGFEEGLDSRGNCFALLVYLKYYNVLNQFKSKY